MSCKNRIVKATVAGSIAALVAGMVVGCGTGMMPCSGAYKVKKSAKKALRSAERYIDRIL